MSPEAAGDGRVEAFLVALAAQVEQGATWRSLNGRVWDARRAAGLRVFNVTDDPASAAADAIATEIADRAASER